MKAWLPWPCVWQICDMIKKDLGTDTDTCLADVGHDEFDHPGRLADLGHHQFDHSSLTSLTTADLGHHQEGCRGQGARGGRAQGLPLHPRRLLEDPLPKVRVGGTLDGRGVRDPLSQRQPSRTAKGWSGQTFEPSKVRNDGGLLRAKPRVFARSGCIRTASAETAALLHGLRPPIGQPRGVAALLHGLRPRAAIRFGAVACG